MLNALTDSPRPESEETARELLAAARRHLGMEVAYISEFVDDRSLFRVVDAPGFEAVIKAGDSISLDDVYCRHILEGQLPELMTDASDYEVARQKPITRAIPIGAHMSVPVHGPDGDVIGMFCCLSQQPNSSLNQRDLEVMRVLAELAGKRVSGRIDAERRSRRVADSIRQVIAETAFRFAYQPIWNFATAKIVGLEALCRFSGEPYRSPDQWFADAADVGLGVELELATIQEAIKSLEAIPETIYLSVNASPETVLSGRLAPLLDGIPAGRLVLEVTEHARVDDYDALAAAIEPIRRAGVGLAIDDAGAGFASLQHILSLQPDRIKLDASLTREIDDDPARRALAAALVFFSRETDAVIIAEGIETEAEYNTLRALGIPKGQGYFLARPTTLDQALAMIDGGATAMPETLATVAL